MLNIGFMQGRLSPISGGKIQSFPIDFWQNEISSASSLGFDLMEWTLDADRLMENPMMSRVGRGVITALCNKYGISVPSVTCDCFMQEPFWKAAGHNRKALKKTFICVVENVSEAGVKKVIVPLVDNGSPEDDSQWSLLKNFLLEHEALFQSKNVKILFEMDLCPVGTGEFLTALRDDIFGINYDTGNSASLGFAACEELGSYGRRVFNVHIKDRLFRGGSVPLTQGCVDFPEVFRHLHSAGYRGDFILQTARSDIGDHAGVLLKYKKMVQNWLYSSDFNAIE